jgi:hypothetical protein
MRLKKILSYKPWHITLWLTLYLLTLSGFALNHYWQHWATDYREKIVHELRRYTPNADYILYHATRSWLPWPWKSELETAFEDNIVQIERSIRLKFDKFGASEIVNVSWNDFKRLVSQWDARDKICQLATRLDFNHHVCENSEKLPNAWAEYFENNFDSLHYISYVDERPVFGNRSSTEAIYCNTAPIASNFTVLKHLSSLELSEFYRTAMQRDQYPLEKTNAETLHPGDCRTLHIASYDVPADAVFSVTPQNPALEGWFYDNWKRYHASWLDNSEHVENLANLSRQGIATTLCDDTQTNGVNFNKLDETKCQSGEPEKYFYGQYLSAPEGIFFAANYPGFSDYSQYLTGAGTLQHDALNAILEEARQFGDIAEKQFWLAHKWDSESPRFVLGATLNNSSGPLAQGISASNIPQTTILDDVLQIPTGGTLYEINGVPIYSVNDVHEVLTTHGDTKGIMSPINVNIYNEHEEIKDASYVTRFQFNPYAQQRFDTNVSALDIGSYGMFFKSTRFNCFVKNIFSTSEHESVDRCAWIDEQRFAYAKQTNPQRFDSSITFGNIAGAIMVPLGTMKGLKLLNGTQRMSTFSRVMLTGTAEAFTMDAYARADGPPSEPPEERSARGFEAAKEGFIYGSVFALILR